MTISREIDERNDLFVPSSLGESSKLSFFGEDVNEEFISERNNYRCKEKLFTGTFSSPRFCLISLTRGKKRKEE